MIALSYKQMRVTHVQPRFPPTIWNVHEQTLNDDPRTNNIAESWNNKFRHLVGHKHPTIWNLIRGFQMEHAHAETIRVQFNVGNPPPAKKATYKATCQHKKIV